MPHARPDTLKEESRRSEKKSELKGRLLVSVDPSILYAPRHQAISAFLGVVASTPDYVDDGDLRSFTNGTKFALKVKTPQEGWPDATEWTATGDATSLGHVAREVANFLRGIWPDTAWVKPGNEVIWVPARPISTEVERNLLQQFYAERMRQFSAA